jgi:ceramide glucosyltransferase
MLESLLLFLTVASWLYWVFAWWHVRTFFRAQPELNRSFMPPVSVLKPVKGLDAQAYQNFVSFCQQDYPDFELLFGVSSPVDPAISVVRRLQQDFPQRHIRLVVCPNIGMNRKVSILHALTAQARCETLVISDSDMRVTPDYLRRVVAPLADERTGLVTCLYRGESALNLTARLEALHMGVTFLPSVIVARKYLAMRFALGATMALRQSDLARIGGFTAVADCLADDYQTGARIASLGLRVHLSDYVVASVLGATTFRDQWDREIRWIRCARVSRPWEYPALLLTFSTPLAATLTLVTGFQPSGWQALGVSVLLRWLIAWQITGYTGDRESRRWLAWLPVRDMLSAAVWCVGMVGRRVTWRGETFIVYPDGRMQSLSCPGTLSVTKDRFGFLRGAVRGLDTLLRRCLRIYEFTQEEECLLRIAIGRSDADVVLSDGTCVHRGEPIGELHFWNERIPPMPGEGPDLAWAFAFQRRLVRSLAALADEVESDSRFRDVKAFRGVTSFGSQDGRGQVARLVEQWGFELVDRKRPIGILGRFISFWENLYTWGIIWTFNPASLQGKSLRRLRREQLWISRKELVHRYGSNQNSRPARK